MKMTTIYATLIANRNNDGYFMSKSTSIMLESENRDQCAVLKIEHSKTKSHHYVVLTCLFELVNSLSNSLEKDDNLQIVFYPSNRNVTFEWDEEYKKDGRFADSTRDREIWQRIVDIVESSSIELIISDNLYSIMMDGRGDVL